MNVIHFKNQKDRLDFLKGNFEEIEPKKAEPTEIIPQIAEEKAEEKPKEGEEKPKKAKKSAKKSKKEGKDDKVQAE